MFPQLIEDETITAVLPLPEDETTYDELSVVFATASGKVRRMACRDAYLEGTLRTLSP